MGDSADVQYVDLDGETRTGRLAADERAAGQYAGVVLFDSQGTSPLYGKEVKCIIVPSGLTLDGNEWPVFHRAQKCRYRLCDEEKRPLPDDWTPPRGSR